MECDEICLVKQAEEKEKLEADEAIKRMEEEIKNQRELELYQKKFSGKKKNKDRRVYEEEENASFVKKYWMLVLTVFIVIASIVIYLALD